MTDYVICAKCKRKVAKENSGSIDLTSDNLLGDDGTEFYLCDAHYEEAERMMKEFVGWIDSEETMG